MTFKQTLQSILLGGAALFGGYQLLGPNTQYDKLTAKHLWCEKDTAPEGHNIPINPEDLQVEDVGSLKTIKMDWLFKNSRTGESLHYGNIELKVTDSRPQTADYGPNDIGTDETAMIQLQCPGYIQFDVQYNGKVVPGGKGIEIVYAAKFWGSGSLFDGWPDFSFQDVLKETALGSAKIEQILRETVEVMKAKRTRKDYQSERTPDFTTF